MIAYGTAIAEALINQRFTDEQAGFLPFVESVLWQFEQPDQFVTVRSQEQHLAGLRELLETKSRRSAGFAIYSWQMTAWRNTIFVSNLKMPWWF